MEVDNAAGAAAALVNEETNKSHYVLNEGINSDREPGEKSDKFLISFCVT